MEFLRTTSMVMGDRFYALSDLPMPALDEEDDARSVRLEFLLAGEKRFPWDRAYRGAFTYVACSKCYVACHPEKMKARKATQDNRSSI